MFWKLCKLISALLLCLLLLGCGAEDPNLGLYRCYELSSGGVKLAPEEMFSGEISLALDRRGRGRLTVDGESGLVSWSLNGEELSLDLNGKLSPGELKDGRIMLRLYGSDTVLYLAKEGCEPKRTKPEGDIQALGGDWYGAWKISEAYGQWADYEGLWYDLCGDISFEEGGEGRIRLWDEDFSREEPMALVYLLLTEDGSALSTDGYFMNCRIGEGVWNLDVSRAEYDRLLRVSGSYEETDGGFEYELWLRPWGMLWDDLSGEKPEMIPFYYEKWYLPLAQEGSPMPDSIKRN